MCSSFVDTLASEADEALRYQDPDLEVPDDPNEIDAAAVGRAIAALNRLRMNDPERLADWFGRFITTYRSPGAVEPGPVAPRIELEWQLDHGASLHRHPLSRMAWRRSGRTSIGTW